MSAGGRATDELAASVYGWRLVYSEKPRGHALWADDGDGGRLALADNSARLPHETEDGVLWVDAERSPVLGDSGVTVPVIKDRVSLRLWTSTSMAMAMACGFRDFVVKTDGGKRRVLLTVKEVLDEQE